MKGLLTWIILFTGTAATFAQGKVGFANDSLRLVYFTTNAARLNYGDAALAGTGPSLSTVYADTNTVLVAELYYGTSSNTVTTLATNATSAFPNPSGIVGRWPLRNLTLPVPGGTNAWFQVQIHDRRDASEAASAAAIGHYYGHSIIFSLVPGSAIVYNPLYNTNSPAFSTWAPGSFDMSAAYGTAGAMGVIELQANVSNAPRITSQPSSLSVTQGLSASFSVGAAGLGPFGYQWLKEGSVLSDSANVAGSSSSILNLNAVTLSDAGGYAVIITNDYGSVTSSVATLTVLAPPLIEVQPQSLQALAGSNVVFSVIASGYPPPSYRWSINGVNLPGATAATLILTNVQLSQAGDYAVALTNSLGYATSAPATLTVFSAPQAISQPASLTAYWGSNATFQVLVQGTAPFYYQWYFNGTALNSQTNATLNLSDLSLDDSGQFWVVVTNAYGSFTSSVASLLVNPAGISFALRPSITISGTVGKSFGIQYVRQIGENWITITNLTLTDPVQLWVDIDTDATDGSHPTRLYRVVPVP